MNSVQRRVSRKFAWNQRVYDGIHAVMLSTMTFGEFSPSRGDGGGDGEEVVSMSSTTVVSSSCFLSW